MSRRTFDIGDEITLTGTFTDPGTGELADPDDVAASVLKPDGTTIEPTTAQQSTGVYTTTVTPAEGEHGQWWWRIDGTGGLAASGERYFMVRKQQVS